MYNQVKQFDLQKDKDQKKGVKQDYVFSGDSVVPNLHY